MLSFFALLLAPHFSMFLSSTYMSVPLPSPKSHLSSELWL